MEEKFSVEENSVEVEGEMMLEWTIMPMMEGKARKVRVRHRMMRPGCLLKMY